MTARLPYALAALFAAQFLHGLAPAPDDVAEDGGFVGFVGGVGFLLATALAWFTSPVTNPYWGDGSASGWQWASLPLVLAAGAATAVLAASGERGRSPAAA